MTERKQIAPGKHEQASSVRMLEAAAAIWEYDQRFYHFSIDGERVGAICLDDIDEDDQLCLGLVKVKRHKLGQGIGEIILDAVCKMADAHGVDLYIEVVSTGDMSDADLIAWYGRHSFEPVEGSPLSEGPSMLRMPQPVPDDGPAPPAAM